MEQPVIINRACPVNCPGNIPHPSLDEVELREKIANTVTAYQCGMSFPCLAGCGTCSHLVTDGRCDTADNIADALMPILKGYQPKEIVWPENPCKSCQYIPCPVKKPCLSFCEWLNKLENYQQAVSEAGIKELVRPENPITINDSSHWRDYQSGRQVGFNEGVAATIKANQGYQPKEINRPKIVCLCGSVKFTDAFRKANLELTLAGVIVLTIGCNMKTDKEFDSFIPEHLESIKTKLDELHKRKIDLADEVLILNVGGYIGDSTRSELEYAKAHNKVIRYLEAVSEATKKGE